MVLTAALLAPSLLADEKEKAKSGCQPGEGLVPFDVFDVTGEFKPGSVCYV
jgi:hypothetical protein